MLEDVVDGKASADAARDLYGLVLFLDPPSIDDSGTAALRRALATEQDTKRP